MPSNLLERMLEQVVKRGANDLHLIADRRPLMRRHGKLVELEKHVPLTAAEVMSVLKEIAADKPHIIASVENEATANGTNLGGGDFAIPWNGTRFRVNACRTQLGPSLVMRRIPSKIYTPEQLGLPPVLIELAKLRRGIIFVTGPTGSGKTTTLASMVDMLLELGDRNIITLEEPVEYEFKHKNGKVTQREVPGHSPTFFDGIRFALRQDPDVIMVGEVRDMVTMEAALMAAQTGHLVFGTLHTNDAQSTIDRALTLFPADRHREITSVLASTLRGVVCQQLLPRADGRGQIAAFEIFKVTSAIRNQIRADKTHDINNAIQTGKKHGMQLLDDHLIKLGTAKLVAAEEAVSVANDPEKVADALRSLLNQEESSE